MSVASIVKGHFGADDAQVTRSVGPTMHEVLVTWGTRRNMVAKRYRVIVFNGEVSLSKAM